MENKTHPKSTISVSEGVQQPDLLNNEAVKRLKNARKKNMEIDEFVEGILNSNRTLLSQAITLIESSLPGHQEKAQMIIEKCLPYSGNSIRIGITGVPGVGKSTFIEALGTNLTSQGRKIAVLAIDPSSERSGGSILGDKTRMELLSADPNAFIRPSPSGGSLGGVARKTRESVILCEAAGFDTIIIETVGVGQSETAVHSMVDFFLLLMLAGAGDELQGMKRGIMEMADLITINKADGNNIDQASIAKAEYQNALHLFPPSDSGWEPGVLICSARNNTGITDIWNKITEYRDLGTQNGFINARRNQQAKYWMYESVNNRLKEMFFGDHSIQRYSLELEKEVIAGKISSFIAAERLLNLYLKKIKNKV
jgi:LAO/AO transport system kinase